MLEARTVIRSVVFIVICAIALWGQQKPVFGVEEFPVTMKQNVVAGKTPVGAKVEARLTMGTLVSGKVIPEGAIFTGEVVESVAKSANSPSRLALRMDSVHWKSGSATVTTYLTSWYYPLQNPAVQDLANEPPGPPYGPMGIPRRGPGTYPGTSDGSGVPGTTSDHRVEMKDVESEKRDDGSLAIQSTRTNLKLDKSTTYVLATGDLSLPK
jgi:hypothetical protein